MYVFFQDGVMRLTSAVRSAFPKGSSAPWVIPFLEALVSGHGGGSFERYSSGGPLDCLRRKVDPDAAVLLLDAQGAPLELRSALQGEDLSSVPTKVCFVVGGPRGFAPYQADVVSSRISEKHGPKVTSASLRGGVQFASSVVSFLQVSNENGQLRPALSGSYGEGGRRTLRSVNLVFRAEGSYVAITRIGGDDWRKAGRRNIYLIAYIRPASI